MSWKSRGGEKTVSRRWTLLLCVGSFFTGLVFTNRMWMVPDAKDIIRTSKSKEHRQEVITERYYPRLMDQKEEARKILGENSTTDEDLQLLNKTISNLEMELAAARMAQESLLKRSPLAEELKAINTSRRHKYFMVIGINTAFNSRKRRDSVRATWMPQGEKRKKLEEEKGIVICFVIGHGATSGGILDRTIEAEDRKHGDFLRLNHVEGYLELSAKTRTYFATAVSLWDANFYVKVDDDVHVNIATLGTTLARHRLKPRVYVGCMKCGPVLARKHMLHKYANEDVSLGSWFIGLDVEHIDDRKLCCGTPPDCEGKARAGNTCVASFDWNCSGICNSVDRIKEVHRRCGENESAIWNAVY